MDVKEIKELFYRNELSRFWNVAESKMKNGINIHLEKEDENNLHIGQSKIGGCPDLPKEIEWFKYKEKSMSFLAQINLAEIKSFDLDNKLPNEGILYFFYDSEGETWGFDPNDKECFQVYFYKDDLNNLERKKAPVDLEDYQSFDSCKLKFKSVISFPHYFSSLMRELELNDDETEKYFEIIEQINGGGQIDVDEPIINKILGHSDNIQDGMELECELVTNGLYCGNDSGYNDPRAKELSKNTDKWNLLFQIDSNEAEAGMVWGLMGRLYFWIKENDLREEKFENTWVILQCS